MRIVLLGTWERVSQSLVEVSEVSEVGEVGGKWELGNLGICEMQSVLVGATRLKGQTQNRRGRTVGLKPPEGR